MPLSNYGNRIIVIIVGLILLFLPFIIRSQHWIYVINLAGLESVVVIGFVLQYRVRLISFCAATFWGIGAYISGLLSTAYDVNFWFCLVFSGLGAALVAFVLGALVIRAGWVTFLMISIVIAEVFVEALGHIQGLGGWDGISKIPRPAIGSFVFVTHTSYYYLILALIIICVVIFYAFYKSPIGKAWVAIGQSSELAASVGVNVFRYRLAAYVVACFTAGLSGSLYAHYSTYIVPSTFQLVRSLYMSISAVIGGLNFVVAGPIVGAVVMKALPELFRIADKYEPILVGAMIILSARFFRKGILGLLSKYRGFLL